MEINVKDIKRDPFDEYVKNLPPTRKELGQALSVAIGLQDVDRLKKIMNSTIGRCILVVNFYWVMLTKQVTQ